MGWSEAPRLEGASEVTDASKVRELEEGWCRVLAGELLEQTLRPHRARMPV